MVKSLKTSETSKHPVPQYKANKQKPPQHFINVNDLQWSGSTNVRLKQAT